MYITLSFFFYLNSNMATADDFAHQTLTEGIVNKNVNKNENKNLFEGDIIFGEASESDADRMNGAANVMNLIELNEHLRGKEFDSQFAFDQIIKNWKFLGFILTNPKQEKTRHYAIDYVKGRVAERCINYWPAANRTDMLYLVTEFSVTADGKVTTMIVPRIEKSNGMLPLDEKCFKKQDGKLLSDIVGIRYLIGKLYCGSDGASMKQHNTTQRTEAVKSLSNPNTLFDEKRAKLKELASSADDCVSILIDSRYFLCL